MGIFRDDDLNEQYRLYKETDEFKETCVLCACPAIETFTYWKIIRAKFPYNKLASEHNMLLPLRHTVEEDLTEEERAEFMHIKYSEELQGRYHTLMESTHQTRSIPPHFHLHLVVLK